MKKPQNHSQSTPTTPCPYQQWQQKQSQPSLTIRQNGTQQGLWHRWRSLRKQQVSHSMSTIIDKRTAVRVTNKTESPYLIKKHTQIAKFSVVTPEQSKYIKPKDMAVISMIPQGDPHLTVSLNELLRTNRPEQQSNTFWFPTPENPVKPEDHTPIQTRILKELVKLKKNEKLNAQESTETGNKFLKRHDWTDTLLREKEKQANEDFLVDYLDSPETFEQSWSAFAKQDWSWQLRNVTLESDNLNS